ncbi:Lipoprotein-releasing system transmembrane protein [Desulfonema limicola]|uniref:Lipoprotein-releasing system transmembrane protein n=1 Tax=Desulfonema limicola TaxID=45656 RepID=A0A975B668_9BACT|nr:lipoprotein-releasing ABC transporter permease subunit [Desulfonema limicola]QTA79531.1 Lipoprotein-releasing system transmembrane protein [Desulfonema limicola]
MSFEFFIGRRYLKARKKHAFISLITFLSTAGVALGVMVMIVVIAVMSGAESELRARMLGVSAHIIIMRHSASFQNYEQALNHIKKTPGVTAATPYIYAQAMLRTSSGISGAVLRGVDPETAGRVIKTLDAETLKQLSQNTFDSKNMPAIILGKELAANLKVKKDDLIFLTVPKAGSDSKNRIPGMKRFKVAGIYQSGLYEYDKSLAYISLEKAQEIIGVPDTISGIEVNVKDIYKAGDIADTIVSDLGFSYLAQDWMQMNKNIFSALKLQKTVMFIILVLIILVAAFNIASALIMMVMEKTRDIAILKAMGATNQSIRKIFVYKGMVIGSIGTFLGMFSGFILCFILKKYKFIKLPPDVYFFPTLPISLEITDIVIIAASTMLICFVSTLYPSHKAARLNPVDALRYG